MTATQRFWLAWGTILALLLLLAAWGLARWNMHNVTGLVSHRLVLLSELRKDALQEYFATAEAELRFWSTNPDIHRVQASFKRLWEDDDNSRELRALGKTRVDRNPATAGDLDKLDTSGVVARYNDLHNKLHPIAELFVGKRGYYDFFLIGPDGDVYYTVEKEADFASNLEQGEWRDSGLAKVFMLAKRQSKEGTIAISDMRPYGPSGDAPAMFMATALQGPAGNFLGVIAFQLPTDKIVAIMNYTSGMGETGETYLVGQDKLMRSNSRFSSEPTILRQSVDTPTVSKALEGMQGVDIVADYRGVEVMSAYTSLTVGDSRWGVMAEIDREEIGEIAARERPKVGGILLFVYGLSLWSLWYWQGRELSADGMELASMDFSGDDSTGLNS